MNARANKGKTGWGDENLMHKEERAQDEAGTQAGAASAAAMIKMRMLFQGQWEDTAEVLRERTIWSNLSLRKITQAEETDRAGVGAGREQRNLTVVQAKDEGDLMSTTVREMASVPCCSISMNPFE